LIGIDTSLWGTANQITVVLAGSSGESATLSVEEKSMLVKKTREIADRLGKTDFTVTMGCLAGSTRDILVQIEAAYKNGADFALTLVPSIFHWAMTQKAITDFFEEVADRSPIPIVIYNFPNLLSGLDVNCDMLEKLGAHPNIAAVKLTCGGVGKAQRVATQFEPAQFTSLSGMSDWLVAAFAAGSTGCISGVANIFPRVRADPVRGNGYRLLTDLAGHG
jgi:dihydrodipicolinate synthase/N-acetylneuraminate lyase